MTSIEMMQEERRKEFLPKTYWMRLSRVHSPLTLHIGREERIVSGWRLTRPNPENIGFTCDRG